MQLQEVIRAWPKSWNGEEGRFEGSTGIDSLKNIYTERKYARWNEAGEQKVFSQSTTLTGAPSLLLRGQVSALRREIRRIKDTCGLFPPGLMIHHKSSIVQNSWQQRCSGQSNMLVS